LVFFVFRGYFSGWPPPTVLAAFVASLVMGFLLGFYLEATLGMLGFWLLEVSSLLFVYMLFSFFFSGHMFPIDMLPGIWGQIVEALPLKYLAYFPAAVFLGKVQGQELAVALWVELAWVAFFMVASRVALNRGYRRYSGFGG
jgi:ABC-2 type transport system permease protein